MSTTKTPHLYLIDGSGYIFRAYHALPPMTNPVGTPVNAVLGYSNMLFKLLQDVADENEATHFAVIFDAARKTFRSDIYPEYKANRPPAPEDLVPQFPLIREATEAFSLPAIDMPGFEADDLIATYAKQASDRGWQVTIVSSDKDLMQLVNDRVTMLDSMKNRHIGVAEVIEKFGVGPDKVIEVQALAGDSADNVPGIPGIGIKTAAQLINEYGDLETVLAHAHEIKQPKRRQNLQEFADLARISKELVTLKLDTPIEATLDDFVLKDIDPAPILAFVDTHGFRSLKVKLLSHLNTDTLTEALGTAADEPEMFTGETDYECVTTLDRLDHWIALAYDAGIVAFDTETTNKLPMKADLVGVSLSVEAGSACYIPLAHVGAHADGGLDFDNATPEQIPFDDAIARLKPLLEDAAVLKVGQNIKYDLIIMGHVGVSVAPFDDTMLISYVLEAGLHNHGMDELAGLHFDLTPISFKQVAGVGKAQVTFDHVPLDKACDYAAEDADITGRLHRLLKPRLASTGLMTVYERLERPLVPVLAAMERHGIKVDTQVLQRLSNDFGHGCVRLEGEIHTLSGHPFNIASPKQLGEVLFGEMGLKGGKKSPKTGAWSTSADVLEKLASDGHELPGKVIEWRQLAKLKSTYTDALLHQINPKTGRVHTSFTMASTTTGRLSSNDPNLQNIPIRRAEGRKIRTAFIAEPGHKLIAADYSQIELRLLAHIAGIDALKDAFLAGADIHAMTASEVFGVPVEGMDPMVRRQAKAINFGIIYGISAFGLANQLGCSRGDAQGYINAYFERFPGIRTYMDETKEFAHANGFVKTVFGRKCHVKTIMSKNPAEKAFGERAAINAPIQGSAADVIRRAMVRMDGALRDAGLNAVRMLLQVHDELIFEVPEDLVERAVPVIRETMEQAHEPALQIDVPLIVDVGIGDNWDEAH